MELAQAANRDECRVRLGKCNPEGGDGFVRLAGLLVGEAEPLVCRLGFRVGRLSKAENLDGLIGFFPLKKSSGGLDNHGLLRGIRLGGSLEVLDRSVRLASKLKAAACEKVGETLDAVQELRILGAGFLLDIDAVNA